MKAILLLLSLIFGTGASLMFLLVANWAVIIPPHVIIVLLFLLLLADVLGVLLYTELE